MKVLVAEDEAQTAQFLSRALHRAGHSVILASDGEEALTLGRTVDCDVILLNLMLPRIDGFTLIRTLREEKRNTPAIILSARAAMQDIVRGLDAGADDYLTKPFALDVLLARIRAVSRRNPVINPIQPKVGDLLLHSGTHTLSRHGRTAGLTRTEFVLLELLMRRAGSVVPHSVLIDAGWKLQSDVTEGTLYVFMRALRAKIAQAKEPQLLHTVRGVGYSLRAASSVPSA